MLGDMIPANGINDIENNMQATAQNAQPQVVVDEAMAQEDSASQEKSATEQNSSESSKKMSTISEKDE